MTEYGQLSFNWLSKQDLGEDKLMDKKIKKEWLRSLRSGEYDQNVETLVTKDAKLESGYAFCCLGVLTNIYHEQHGTEFTKCEQEYGMLSDKVQEWANLSDDKQEKLAFMNDDGMSFDEIADYIQENL